MNFTRLRFFSLILMLLFSSASANCFPGNETESFGPRTFSCGRVSGPLVDAWSVQNNPGALGFLSGNTSAVSFERRYSAFSLLAFSAALKHQKLGSFGLGISRFGPEFFSQSRAGISWGKAFGIAALGLQAQWYQVNATQTTSRHYLLINFGGVGKLGDKLLFSGTVSNITQTKAGDYSGNRLPTVFKAGLAFQPNPSLLLMAELQKDLDEDAGVNAGMEYKVAKSICIRTGFSTASKTGSLGFGLNWRDFQLDAGSSWHTQLGFSHCMGLSYFIPQTRKPIAGMAK